MSENRSMNIEQWLWCMHCERGFKVYLSNRMDAEVGRDGQWFHELELQLGVESEINGKAYVECPYDGCDGDPLDFWDWEVIRAKNQYPEVPEEGTVYPMYPNSDPNVWWDDLPAE